MSQTLDQLLDNLRIRLAAMKPEQRVELFSEIRAGFCQHCGRAEPDGRYCQCENDE